MQEITEGHSDPNRPLAGLRIIECASFVAGPSGGVALAQLGADVIRVDPLGGAADLHRWPVSTRTGASMYWAALNRGKRSVAVNLGSAEGRELVLALVGRPGPDNGILVENQVGRSWLTYQAVVEQRPDAIQIHVQGHADGRPAVDYTVNPEVGVPAITGPVGMAGPVNHVLPAWDLLTGMNAVAGLLAALRRRERTGEGSYVQVALSDVALSGVASMGWLAEAEEQGDRPRHGNHVFGSFGIDFATSDGHRVMVVALTMRQWEALRDVTNTNRVFSALEDALGIDLTQEADRYRLRETIAAILRPWFTSRTLADASAQLEVAHVLWSRYRSMREVVEEFHESTVTSVLVDIDQPGIGRVVSSRSPLRFAETYGQAATAPTLGQHTDEVLANVLGLDGKTLGGLHDRGIIGNS